jgi:hypothetical protein
MTDDRSTARQAGLLAFVMVATVVLLAGGWALLGRAANGGAHPSASLGATVAVSSAAPSSPSGSRQPPASADGSGPPTITLTGAGDIADCSRTGAGQTSDILLRETGSIFTAGDNAYEDGSPGDFSACYGPTWGRVLDRTVLTAAGNHDWQTPGAAGYIGYFGTALAAPRGVTWSSKDLGAWHVVVLDSDCANVGGCSADSPQGRWLAADLAASSAMCTLAIWHHPRFSSGEHGNDAEVAPFWEQLHAAGAELIVNGHDHDYERFAPQDPSGAVERPGGLREIVVGTGGGELRPFHGQVANSEFREAGAWGVLRLTLHPANYDWEFLPVAGDIADSGSTPCH